LAFHIRLSAESCNTNSPRIESPTLNSPDGEETKSPLCKAFRDSKTVVFG
jgi:hypothetical protein